MTLRHVGTLVLAGSLAVCAPASAFAGNGNGKENGTGNSASAPGQVKKEEAAAAQAAQAQVQAEVTASQAADAPPQAGVKPSSDTAHDTHAPAASDRTKEYGNGKTAGEIAMQNGAAPTTSLHGPGNSQPHKASPCSGGHEVDVHALKGKRGGSCGSSTPTPRPTPVPDPGPRPQQSVPPSSGSPASSTQGSTPSGTVVVGGVTPKPKSDHPGGKPRVVDSGTLGYTGTVASATTLPFTGLDLWSAVFVGAMLILIGLALCRRAATIPAYESDPEVRP